MKVLWFANAIEGLGPSANGYHGEGWVESLMNVATGIDDLSLHISFPSDDIRPFNHGKVCFHPVKRKVKGRLGKILWYYGGYRFRSDNTYLEEARSIINEVRPDIVQVFGFESPFACVVGRVAVPVVVHIQGILDEYSRHFFPPGMGAWDFAFPPSIRETLLRNGFIFAYRDIKVRASIETRAYERASYTFGRTGFDRRYSMTHAPYAAYFHVDEVLRPTFYAYSGQFRVRDAAGVPVLVTTASETVYKGLDLMLRTGQALKKEYGDGFRWNVAGISAGSDIVRHFERFTGIRSEDAGINYAGPIKPAELKDLLMSSDIYVHTSYCDNSPNSLCEAMMLGMPCIAASVMGVPDILGNGKDGILLPAGDYRKFASAVCSLWEDADERERLGRSAAGSAARRHNRESIKDQLLDSYNRILGSQS